MTLTCFYLCRSSGNSVPVDFTCSWLTGRSHKHVQCVTYFTPTPLYWCHMKTNFVHVGIICSQLIVQEWIKMNNGNAHACNANTEKGCYSPVKWSCNSLVTGSCTFPWWRPYKMQWSLWSWLRTLKHDPVDMEKIWSVCDITAEVWVK